LSEGHWRRGAARCYGLERPGITRLNFCSVDRVQSVEPFIAIDLEPGAEKRWSYAYTYSQK
jgi:hypothetical protein